MALAEFICFSNSEKEEDDTEKREDPGDHWEEGGGGGGGVEKSSGPWNKTAPVQAAPAPVVGKLNISVSKRCLVYVKSGNYTRQLFSQLRAVLE